MKSSRKQRQESLTKDTFKQIDEIVKKIETASVADNLSKEDKIMMSEIVGEVNAYKRLILSGSGAVPHEVAYAVSSMHEALDASNLEKIFNEDNR